MYAALPRKYAVAATRNHGPSAAAGRRATAVTPSEFEAWLEDKRRTIKASNDAAAQQREQVDAGENP